MHHLVNMDHLYYDNLQNPQQQCELMTINVNTLISEVETRSVLWDRNNLYYTDRFIKRAAWQEVYKALHPNFDYLPKLQQLLIGNAIERRWRGLRENFSKRVRNEKQVDQARRIPYLYNQQLDFLRKVIITKTASNDPDIEDCMVDSQSSQKGSTLEEKLVQFLEAQSEMVRDDHQNFFDSLLPVVRKFDEQQALSFRTHVLSILQEVRFSLSEPSAEKICEEPSDSSMDTYSSMYPSHQPETEQEQNFEPPRTDRSAYVSQGPSSTSGSGIGSPICASSIIQTAVCVALNMHQDSHSHQDV